MLVGTAVISYVGSMFFPFALWPQSIFGIYTKATGQPFVIPYGLYFGMILALSLIHISKQCVSMPKIM